MYNKFLKSFFKEFTRSSENSQINSLLYLLDLISSNCGDTDLSIEHLGEYAKANFNLLERTIFKNNLRTVKEINHYPTTNEEREILLDYEIELDERQKIIIPNEELVLQSLKDFTNENI